MNKLIDELSQKAEDHADQAESWTEDRNKQFSWLATYTEKLTELIIKDCAEAVLAKGRASPDTDFRTGSYVISEYLLSRYGVEE
jgi:hypothetical protein